MPEGHTNNPRGRPPGSKNKITKDFHDAYEAAIEKGYKHPYQEMMEWVHDASKPLEIRAAMLKECASYTCVKPKQTIGIEPETVPVFQSEDQAEQFLAEFIATIAPDLDPIELATMTRQYIMSKREGEELHLKRNPPETLPQRIEIINSPGPLPGTNIDMSSNSRGTHERPR